jgi:uncharacterized protein (TIGR02118 family)
MAMTVKLVVLYTQPDDPDAFDQHYLGVHAPLVLKVPGLQRFEGARISGPADRGEATYFRIAELYFADPAALQAGLGSEEGQRRPPTTSRSRRQVPGCTLPPLTNSRRRRITPVRAWPEESFPRRVDSGVTAS